MQPGTAEKKTFKNFKLRLYCNDKKAWPKATWDDRVYFSFQLQVTVCHRWKSCQELNQDRTLEVRSKGEALEECYLLACPP